MHSPVNTALSLLAPGGPGSLPVLYPDSQLQEGCNISNQLLDQNRCNYMALRMVPLSYQKAFGMGCNIVCNSWNKTGDNSHTVNRFMENQLQFALLSLIQAIFHPTKVPRRECAHTHKQKCYCPKMEQSDTLCLVHHMGAGEGRHKECRNHSFIAPQGVQVSPKELGRRW